jgi:hypothetical protein
MIDPRVCNEVGPHLCLVLGWHADHQAKIENDTVMQPGQPRFRVGNHQPQNIYDGDKYIGVMFSAPHAARVVAALNDTEARFTAERWPT